MEHTIGNTPIIELNSGYDNIRLFVKNEIFNPTGSIKDRVANYIIQKAKNSGLLKPGQLIVEASSGNMGTSLAAIALGYGHPVHITCPDKTGNIKRKMIEKFGAKLTICPSVTDHNDPKFYVNVAKSIAAKENGFLVNQYDNSLNTECHFSTTGQEIIDYFIKQDLNLDYFVTVGGSGGTISGCARKIKSFFPKAKIVMPDPIGSIYYDLFYHGHVIEENIKPYKVEGPGNPVFCQSMDLDAIDEIMQFSDQEAFEGCDQLARKHGLCGGHSTGANYHIVKKLIDRLKKQKKPTATTILFLIPDSGMKYL
ncbi:MAG: PLP-dependent cysteine synthase family protein [Francisellaceae bacterium]